MKHTVLPDGQPPTVALTVFAQLCDPKAKETEMGAAFFTNNGEGRNFDFDFLTLPRDFQREERSPKERFMQLSQALELSTAKVVDGFYSSSGSVPPLYLLVPSVTMSLSALG